MMEHNVYMELEELLIKTDNLEGLAYVLWDSTANGNMGADRKVGNAASLLADLATEIRETLETIINNAEISKKGAA